MAFNSVHSNYNNRLKENYKIIKFLDTCLKYIVESKNYIIIISRDHKNLIKLLFSVYQEGNLIYKTPDPYIHIVYMFKKEMVIS